MSGKIQAVRRRIPAILRDRRELRGVTRQALADATGVRPNAIATYEADQDSSAHRDILRNFPAFLAVCEELELDVGEVVREHAGLRPVPSKGATSADLVLASRIAKLDTKSRTAISLLLDRLAA